MQDKRRTKEDLIREIEELRRRVSTLERAGTKGGKNEDALRESEATLKGILRAAPIGIGIVTNRILGWTNDYITNLLGYSHDELMGQNARILYESDEEFRRIALVKHPQVEQYGVGSVETRFRRKDGKFIDILLSSAAIVPGDMTQGLIYTVLDITERKQAEKVIAESEERYRRITDAVTDYIYTVRVADGRPMSTTHGPACVAVTGFSSEDFARDPYLWINMVHEEDMQLVKDQAESVRSGKAYPVEHRIIRKDGTVRWVRNTPVPHYDKQGQLISYDGLIQDITDRKLAEIEKERLKEQLTQSQKLEAIGTLAGGIAHDFNNILMGIQGYTSLMLLDTEVTNPFYERLKNIEQQVQSGAELTGQLLGFARGGKYEVKPTNMNAIVQMTSEVFGRTKREIVIHRKFDDNLYIVSVDRGQIEQVFLNLYVNAWQAMPAGGELYLETRNVILDASYAHLYSCAPGKYAKISVTDSGVGIDKKIIPRIFEPFFTTKEMGRGTGLGLASVYGIIKSHGGIINVYSEKGEGTTFNIYLPAAEKEIAEEKVISGELVRGTETILLVDDQDTVLSVGKDMLASLGYAVITAASGLDATELYRANRDSIDLVILDMIMPVISGGDTFEGLKEINHEVKVLLASGYSINGMAAKILERGCRGFIQKPFNINELSRKIREILDTYVHGS